MKAYYVEVRKWIDGIDKWGYVQHQEKIIKEVYYAKSKAHLLRILDKIGVEYLSKSITEIE